MDLTVHSSKITITGPEIIAKVTLTMPTHLIEDDILCMTPIDKSGLQPLPDYDALKEGYPVGCRVWYNFRRSSDGEDSFSVGIIVGVSVDSNSTVSTTVFQVRHTDSNNQVVAHAEPEYVRKDWIAYGCGCPIRVKMGQVHVNGDVLSPFPQFDDDGILTSIKYHVQLFKTKTKKKTMQFNIPKRRVEYRQVPSQG